MYKIQLHYHTAESSPCANMPAEQGVKAFWEKGYDGIVVTDHFSASTQGRPGEKTWEQVVSHFLDGYVQARQAGEKLGIQVYLGMEIRFPHDENDFLVYGFTPGFLYGHPWLYMEELAGFRPVASEQHLFVAQAHPFRTVCTAADPQLLDGVEIHNGNCRHDSRNELAMEWAAGHHLTGIVGADFHEYGDVCSNPVYFQCRPADEKGLARALFHRKFSLRI